jgi:DNA-binding MarR family transcriptional regulator
MDELKQCLARLNNDLLRLDRLYNDYARLHGETYLSLAMLEVLADSPEGVSQKRIAQEVFASKQTVSSAIGDLTRRGFVEQRACKRDGRSRPVFLTDAGRDYVRSTVGAMRAMSLEVARGIDASDLEVVHQVAAYYATEFERRMGEEDSHD